MNYNEKIFNELNILISIDGSLQHELWNVKSFGNDLKRLIKVADDELGKNSFCSILGVAKLNKDSLLADGLRRWFGDDQIQNHIPYSIVDEDTDDIYFLFDTACDPVEILLGNYTDNSRELFIALLNKQTVTNTPNAFLSELEMYVTERGY